MAGIKGKGGVKGRSGGARVGAGRKPKPKSNMPEQPAEVSEELAMLELLRRIALGKVNATTIQVRAAIAAVQYESTKRGDGGIKEGQAGAAKDAAKGFTSLAPPLKMVKGGK